MAPFEENNPQGLSEQQRKQKEKKKSKQSKSAETDSRTRTDYSMNNMTHNMKQLEIQQAQLNLEKLKNESHLLQIQNLNQQIVNQGKDAGKKKKKKNMMF